MSDSYDLIVVGAGSAGLTAATFARQLGASVALVERNRVGGDCTWTGCIPSKALIHVAQTAHTIRQAAGSGLQVAPPEVDMPAVQATVQAAIEAVFAQESPVQLAAEGIDLVQGPARFLDANTLAVGPRRLTAGRIILATGARPHVPDIPGLAETPYVTYEQIFDNKQLPQHLLVMGAGPVGVELAQAYCRLGAAVSIVDERLLPGLNPLVGRALTDVLRREGLAVIEGLATAVRRDGEAIVLEIGRQTVRGDMLLVATGRRPNVAGLDLEQAGVVHSEQGIAVNDQLQTSARHIYAAGDCTGGPQYTHYAGWQAFQAVRNALLPGQDPGVTATMPWVIFTDPEIAHVGLDETRAGNGEQAAVIYRDLSCVDRALIEQSGDGFIQVITGNGGRILGATLMAPRAGELITEFTLAIKHGLSIRDLAGTIHPYPTYSSGLQRVLATAATADFVDSAIGRLVCRLSGLRG